jgi:hypothetical protein
VPLLRRGGIGDLFAPLLGGDGGDESRMHGNLLVAGPRTRSDTIYIRRKAPLGTSGRSPNCGRLRVLGLLRPAHQHIRPITLVAAAGPFRGTPR